MRRFASKTAFGFVLLWLCLSLLPAAFAQDGDIPAGELVTLTVAGEFIPGATSASISYQIQDADGNSVEFIPSTYRVFRANGSLPYMLSINGSNVVYTITFEAGDTLQREPLGALAAGQRLEGLLPDDNGIYDYIQLDVEAGKTYIVEQSGAAEVPFVVLDGAVAQVSSNEPPATRSLTFDVAEDNVLPLYLMIEPATNAGEPFAFTLVERGETTQTAAPETTPEATAAPAAAICTITSIGESRQRVGPGTNYELTGLMAPGALADVDGQARGTDGLTWWRLGESFWVRSDLVDEVGDCEAVPIVAAP
jgi:hypothetical protein